MDEELHLKRTTTGNPDFEILVTQLDNELWNELQEDQATYDQYNKVPDIKTAVLVYTGNEPVACGCFKEIAPDTIEIKRMYVEKDFRGKGLSKRILLELEVWAKEKGYQYAVLETSIHFEVAKQLYGSNGYEIISNYGPYVGLADSVCLKKLLGNVSPDHG